MVDESIRIRKYQFRINWFKVQEATLSKMNTFFCGLILPNLPSSFFPTILLNFQGDPVVISPLMNTK